MRQPPPNQQPALSARPQPGCAGCFAWIFAIAFLSAGLGAGYVLTFQPLSGMLRSRGWLETPCVIVSSELKRQGDTSELVVTYTYRVGNQEHQSSRYCFAGTSSNTATGWKQKVIADHPAGRQTKCYVNPADPDEAVIERGWVPEMWWGLFPLPFLLVGIGALLVATGLIRVTDPAAPGKPAAWKPRQENGPGDQESEADDERQQWNSPDTAGPATLKPEVSPLQMLLGSIFVAIFWNGIVSVFVWQIVTPVWKRGFAAIEWFPAIFLVPFVLIGIGLIGFVLYTLLGLFNPRPTLTVSSAAIPLGEELQVNWSLSGRPESIRELKISLKGVEKATYRRGTSTTTDQSTFAEIVMVETTEPFEMAEGMCKVTIPETSMHSFDAPNNKIVWTLEVRGEIPWWPDVSASFPITVLPLPGDQ